MILRRLRTHVENENWFAVFVDFAIVVIGVFIGIQVANWNEARAAERREQVLLVELREELIKNASDAKGAGEGFLVGADSARRILARRERPLKDCVDECWNVIVDLMHASQWQRVDINWTTYDELRRNGLPSNRDIIQALENFQFILRQNASALDTPPAYRTLVRQKIPITLQDAYWANCFMIGDRIEIYLVPCEKPDGVQIDPDTVNAILADRDITTTLREWTSMARLTGETLVESSASSKPALDILDAEISNESDGPARKNSIIEVRK